MKLFCVQRSSSWSVGDVCIKNACCGHLEENIHSHDLENSQMIGLARGSNVDKGVEDGPCVIDPLYLYIAFLVSSSTTHTSKSATLQNRTLWEITHSVRVINAERDKLLYL